MDYKNSLSPLPRLQRVCMYVLYILRGNGRRVGLLYSNWTYIIDPCRTVPCQYHCWGMPGRQAGSPIAVYARVQCREPKTGQKKVQFCCEDDWLWPSCYYLSMILGLLRWWWINCNDDFTILRGTLAFCDLLCEKARLFRQWNRELWHKMLSYSPRRCA